MKPAILNITIYQGSTFIKNFQWKTGATPTPVDITGYKIRMHIREKITSAAPIIICTTENGRIVITDATAGKFKIEIAASDTAAMNFKSAVYDIEMVEPGLGPERVRRLIQGSVTLSPEVTR